MDLPGVFRMPVDPAKDLVERQRREVLLEKYKARELTADQLPDDLLMLLLKAYENWDEPAPVTIATRPWSFTPTASRFRSSAADEAGRPKLARLSWGGSGLRRYDLDTIEKTRLAVRRSTAAVISARSS